MAQSAENKRTIRGAGQLAALSSPARQEVFDTLEASGPLGAAELGRLLGRAPDSLYFHLRRLEEAGLIVRADRPIGRGRSESVYRAAAPDMRLAFDVESAPQRAQLARLFGATLRVTGRDVQRALGTGAAIVRGRRRNFRAGRLKAWLTPAQVREINEHIDAIVGVMRRAGATRGGALHAMTFTLTPVLPSERAAGDKEN